MSTARDAGLAALQSGDTQTAITELEAAVQENPSDFDACLYLGGAYGQAGRHLDAIKSVTQAVQLQPANAQARYNLGVAMEQGGYPDQALQVYNQAIHLQPDYPNAQQAALRLNASSNQGFGSPVSTNTSTVGSGQQFQEAPAQQPTKQYAQPSPTQQAPFNPLATAGEQEPEPYSPLNAPQPSVQPTQAFTPPAQQPPAFARPPIAVAQQQQPVEAGLGSYAAPPPPAARAAGGYGAPPAPGARPGAYSSAPAYDDEFKLGQAFKDFFRAMFTPRALFSEMEGCGTSKSAWALFTLYALFLLISSGITGAMKMSSPGGSIVNSLVSTVEAIGMLLITWLVFAGVVHLLSRAFGSSLAYGGSVRCVIYSAAPFVALMFVLTLVVSFMAPQLAGAMGGGAGGMSTYSPTGTGTASKKPSGKSGHSGKSGTSGMSASSAGGSQFGGSGGQYSFPGASGGAGYGASANPFAGGSMPSGPNSANPMGALLGFGAMVLGVFLVAALWGVIALGIAVSNVHEITGGAGAGVAILSAIIGTGISLGVYFVFIAARISSVMGSTHH